MDKTVPLWFTELWEGSEGEREVGPRAAAEVSRAFAMSSFG